jgi:hypothetical protein
MPVEQSGDPFEPVTAEQSEWLDYIKSEISQLDPNLNPEGVAFKVAVVFVVAGFIGPSSEKLVTFSNYSLLAELNRAYIEAHACMRSLGQRPGRVRLARRRQRMDSCGPVVTSSGGGGAAIARPGKNGD